MAPKYVLVIDYKVSNEHLGYDYYDLEAKDLYEAIEESDTHWFDDVYLMRICEKVGKIKKGDVTGEKVTEHKAILCKRSVSGWHINNEENSEAETVIERFECTGKYNYVTHHVKF